VLGTDALSDLVVAHFEDERVDVSLTRRRAGVGPIRSTILIGRDDGSRTVLSDRNGFVGPDIDWPPAAVIRASRVLFVDHVGVAAQVRAARLARAASVPVVADFERASGLEFPALLELADHLIVTRGFAEELTGERDPAHAARALADRNQAVAVVTAGVEGCWSAVRGEAATVRHQPAFAVEAIDTNGCGDVFHGAYAAALARGEPLQERLRLAAAAAALKATRAEGPFAIPGQAAVLTFLDSHPPELPSRRPPSPRRDRLRPRSR
jgi:sugar/nucleoside kinase (ribokinase family)